MIKKKIEIINKLGLHARAAAKFVNLSGKFSSQIQVKSNSKIVNGKSIMGVMMLAASKGKIIEVIANGIDEEEAITAIEELITNKFGEDE